MNQISNHQQKNDLNDCTGSLFIKESIFRNPLLVYKALNGLVLKKISGLPVKWQPYDIVLHMTVSTTRQFEEALGD